MTLINGSSLVAKNLVCTGIEYESEKLGTYFTNHKENYKTQQENQILYT